MSRSFWSRTRGVLPWVLLLSLLLNTYHIWWGLPLGDRQAWGTDEIAPMGPLVYAKRTFVDGHWSQKYPAFHYMLLNAVGSPLLAYFFVTGQLSMSGISESQTQGAPRPALTVLLVVARLVSAVMGTLTAGFVFLIARQLFGRLAGVFAALITALSFLVIYYSHTSNLDIPYLFWFALGLVFYSRLFTGHRSRDYALLGVCMALAVATKDQAYGLLPAIPLALLWFGFRQRPAETGEGAARGWADLPWRGYGFAALAFVATYLLAANIINNPRGYLEHLQFVAGPGSQPYRQFPATVGGQVRLLLRTTWTFAQSLNVPLFLVCVAGVAVCLVRHRAVTLALLAPLVSYYLLFIAVILYILPRYLLPFVIIFAVFGGKLLADLWTPRGRLGWAVRPAIVGLLVYSLLYGASVDWLLRSDPRYQAEAWLAKHAPAAAVVEAYGPGQYLPRFPRTVQLRRPTLEGSVVEDFQRRAPDYVVLTWAFYRRLVGGRHGDPDQTKLVQGLWNGDLGYQQAAEFKAPQLWAPNLIPGLNSRLTIFERQDRRRPDTDEPR